MVPRFKRRVRALVLDEEHVVLLGEGPHELIEGRLHPLLVPLVDGSRDVDAIVDALQGRARLTDVLFGLSMLEEGGWVTCEAPRSSRAFNEVLTRTIQSHPGVGARAIEVVALDDYLDDAADARAGSARREWLPFKPDPDDLWIGPLVAPPRTPCWGCVRARLLANQPWRVVPALPEFPRDGSDEEAFDEAGELMAETMRRLLDSLDDKRSPLEESIFTWDTATAAWRQHVVARTPSCPRCGAATASTSRPASSPASGPRSCDGGWRTVTPAATLARLQPFVSPITGVISGVESVRDEDVEAVPPVVIAEHLFPAPGRPDEILRTGGRRRSAGKGLTAEQAHVSALAEAIERYSGVFRGDEPRLRATYRELGADAVHPHDWLLFSERQYARREEWNASAPDRARVFSPFDPDWPVEWTLARGPVSGVMRYVPTACTYFGYTLPPDRQFAVADSNGCAAGNTREEAILQGTLELVERDAAALWWYTRARRPSVDLESFEPRLRAHAAGYRALGRSLVVLDLTSDIGIPVLVAISTDAGATHEGLAIGFGAHVDPDIALARALTEVDQWLAALAAGVAAPRLSRDPGDAGFLRPSAAAMSTRDRLARDTPADVDEAVTLVSARLAERGLTLLAIDQTRGEVGFPVVRTLAPGLRHFWPRFAPGRLYTVPRALGWIDAAIDEDALNPVALLV